MSIEGQLIALMWGELHMEETIRGCEHFLSLESRDDLLRHTLISGIISSYTRSFVEGAGLSSIKAKYSKFENSNMKVEHDRICAARRFIYGHRDTLNEASIFDTSKSQEEINRVLVTLSEEGQVSTQIERSSLPDSYIEMVLDLARFQFDRMHLAKLEMTAHFLKSKGAKPGTYELHSERQEKGEPASGGNA